MFVKGRIQAFAPTVCSQYPLILTQHVCEGADTGLCTHSMLTVSSYLNPACLWRGGYRHLHPQYAHSILWDADAWLRLWCLLQAPVTLIYMHVYINTLRPRQNGRRFADDTFKRIFLNENVRISNKISLKFAPKGPINNIPALVQIMAWRRSGDKPLSEPTMVSSPTHICVTRPQWVNERVCVLANTTAHTYVFMCTYMFIHVFFNDLIILCVSLFLTIVFHWMYLSEMT